MLKIVKNCEKKPTKSKIPNGIPNTFIKINSDSIAVLISIFLYPSLMAKCKKRAKQNKVANAGAGSLAGSLIKRTLKATLAHASNIK